MAFTPSEPSDHRALYVIFTSGSTGAPKGICIHHSGFTNLIGGMRLRWSSTTQWVFGISFNYVFDPFQMNLIYALGVLAGRCVLLESGLTLASIRADEALTHLNDVPSTVTLANVPAAVRYIEVGDDAISHSFVSSMPRAVVLVNAYGPTEVSVAATARLVDSGVSSIGRSLPNVRCQVVDSVLSGE